jgi:hypothetical protein
MTLIKLDVGQRADLIHWELFSSKSLSKLPRQRTNSFELQFQVRNISTNPLRVRVYLHSPTQVITFRSTSMKKIRRSRLRKVKSSLDQMRDQLLESSKQKNYLFDVFVRPYLIPQLKEAPFEYLITILDKTGSLINRCDPRRIDIFFEK